MTPNRELSFYGRHDNVAKRAKFYRKQNMLKECGVILAQDKPWYCGEAVGCCALCNRYYKKNYIACKE